MQNRKNIIRVSDLCDLTDRESIYITKKSPLVGIRSGEGSRELPCQSVANRTYGGQWIGIWENKYTIRKNIHSKYFEKRFQLE